MGDETLHHITDRAPGQSSEELVDQFHRMSAQLAESYAALRKSEERFSLAMRGANDGLWDWDLRTNEVYYSPRWKEMLGYSEDEIEPTFGAWERLVQEDDKAQALLGIEAFLSGELDKYEIEFRMRHKQGHYVHVLSRAFGVHDGADGPVVRIVGTHVDITEHKRAEERARRQSEYLSALHDTTLGVIRHFDTSELLEALVERAVDLVGASFGFAYQLAQEGNEIQLTVGTGWFRAYLGTRLRRGEALSGKVWESGRPISVDNFELWSGYIHKEGEIGPAIGVPLFSGNEVVGIIGVARPCAGSPFEQDEIDLIGRFAGLASIALDNARIHASLEQRVQERTHELAALNAVAAVVSQSLDLEEILSAALDQIMSSLRMDAGVAHRLVGTAETTAEPLYLRPLAVRGLAEMVDGLSEPVAIRGTQFEAAAASGAPLVWTTDDPTLDPEVAGEQKAVGIWQVVSVPLMAKGKWVGALYLARRQQSALAQEQLSLLAAVGQQVGMAVENARLYEQAEQAAALAERGRLARELHDSVTQSLYSVTMYAEAAARLLDADQGAKAAEYLRDARDTAQEALREMRLLIFELRPVALEQSGLSGALQARLEAVEKRAGLQVDLRVEGVEDLADAAWLPVTTQQELYYVALEALNNCLKHADASRVEVSLQLEDRVVCLQVIDDGAGFDPAVAGTQGGLGLRGMRERVQRLGGRLQLISAPGNGTTVSVELPRRVQQNGGTNSGLAG